MGADGMSAESRQWSRRSGSCPGPGSLLLCLLPSPCLSCPSPLPSAVSPIHQHLKTCLGKGVIAFIQGKRESRAGVR